MKLIIDVDEEIVRKGFEQPLTEEERNTLIRAIGNGRSYSLTGDLISRSALKAELDDYIDDSLLEIADVKELINNAQVVEAYPFEQVRELIELNQQFAQEIENLKRLQGDLIRRSDALKAVDNRHEELLHDTEYRRKHCDIDLLGIKKHILAIPPVDAIVDTTEVRPKGKWIFVNPLQADDPDDGGAYICSECKTGDWNIRGNENFCPNCGADMRGTKE